MITVRFQSGFTGEENMPVKLPMRTPVAIGAPVAIATTPSGAPPVKGTAMPALPGVGVESSTSPSNSGSGRGLLGSLFGGGSGSSSGSGSGGCSTCSQNAQAVANFVTSNPLLVTIVAGVLLLWALK